MNRHDVMFAVQELREHSGRMSWRGTGGATDKAVYEALLKIAVRIGRIHDSMPPSEVGELAGVHGRTAGRSLKRLRARRLIRLDEPSDGKMPAARWSLKTVPATQVTHTGPTLFEAVWKPFAADASQSVAADIFRWGKGLGKSKWRIWSMLSEIPLGTTDLAAAVGTTRRTVQRHLAELVEYGLATRASDGWVRGAATHKEVADRLGVIGEGTRQKERHRFQRVGYKAARQEYAASEPPERITPDGEVVRTAELRPRSNAHTEHSRCVDRPHPPCSERESRQRMRNQTSKRDRQVARHESRDETANEAHRVSALRNPHCPSVDRPTSSLLLRRMPSTGTPAESIRKARGLAQASKGRMGDSSGSLRGVGPEFGPFTLDVAATAENALCDKYFTAEDDGLAQDWTGVVWCNPPYSSVARWVEKAYASSLTGSTVVCLVPPRTDTRWWHHFFDKAEVRYIQGRLRFSGAKSVAPFPSVLLVFRPTAASGPSATSPDPAGRGKSPTPRIVEDCGD